MLLTSKRPAFRCPLPARRSLFHLGNGGRLCRILARVSVALGSVALPLALATPSHAQWIAPTPEELSMTSQPQVPGAPAVYLFREETSEDNLHMYSVYVRLKVLNEAGKEHANVELRYFAGTASNDTIDSIAGRTIEPDGSIVPFTGKPYQKLIVKQNSGRYMAKVFTMPDVNVGSILEYRYKIRWDDHYYAAPQWMVQSELFERKAHFQWRPSNTAQYLINERGQNASTIAWTPILPEGVTIQQTKLPQVGVHDGQTTFDLSVQDIAPQPEEEFMPPISSFTYRVLFYYTPFRSPAEYWKNQGTFWARNQDKFIGPGPAVRGAAAEFTSGAATSDAKLRKLYDAVEQLENTDFTRRRSSGEDKAEGLRETHTADDVLLHRRGDSKQLAELFIGLARAAGFKAWPMLVTNRDRHIFFPSYLSFSQLDDIVAIVNVDGKEQFFDPGSRFCPFGHLAWKHTMAGGLRAAEGGATVATTPNEPYTASRTQRVANLTLDDRGDVHGTIKMTYIGSPALGWRQHALVGDQASLDHDLRESVEALVPHGLEVKVTSVEKLTSYEQPLEVSFNVSGPAASSTGKRLLLPADLFEANSRPIFPHEKRDVGVYFEYPHMVQDAVRINFPSTLSVESMPKSDKLQYSKSAAYNVITEQSPTSYTVRRNFLLGEIVFPTNEYPELRGFYRQVESKDQEALVLKLSSTPTQKPQTTAASN